MIRMLLLLATLAACTFAGSDYAVSLAVVIGLQALPALGLTLLTGYTGQISLGHAAFYGLGAYGAALLSRAIGISPLPGVFLASLLVGGIAWAIGWLVFRLKGHHLAMATLAFGIIVQIAFVEMHGLTGGPNGLSGIAPLSLFGTDLITDAQVLPIVWGALILALLLAQNLIASPVGLVMRAIAEGDRVVGSLGNDVAAVKRKVMMLSGFLCAVGGGLYAHYVGYLSPGPFDVGFSVRLLLMVALGGFANVWGVLFGVAFVTLVGEALKPLGAFDVIAYGVLLVVSVIFFPEGLFAGIATPIAVQVRRLKKGIAR
ncbi:branched-chain amino acid ABC transporter permease [Aquabacter sp. L1I39]|uniref:branched-chain amino acid ABC transporter permease n=1 Tax=Aquabacter sp. L1I39 TaxID=2820278 RepID=UPI001ADBAC80|nr:branched-chain amino acid ABC transporter permease [Aquabacter sp. L1I39]QTL02681.1 branched-chain amino acid ABC transporter permease [Aquabacter sp. L1I39]